MLEYMLDQSDLLEYTTASGLPQESKLVTYMNRSATPSHQSSDLNESMNKLTMDSAQATDNKAVGSQLQHPPAVGSQLQHPPAGPSHQHQPALLSPERQLMLGDYMPVNFYNPPPMLPTPQNSPPSTRALHINAQFHQENVGGTTYFYSSVTEVVNPPVGINQGPPMGAVECIAATAYATHMYNVPPPIPTPSVPKPPPPDMIESPYLPDTICTEIHTNAQYRLHLSHMNNNYLDPVPKTVQMYGHLAPLEPSSPLRAATSFVALHKPLGELHALRRLHGCGYLMPSDEQMNGWLEINHPNVVRLLGVFNADEFGDNSLMMAYDYHPTATTVKSKYLCISGLGSHVKKSPFADPDAPRPYTHHRNALLRAAANGALLPEDQLRSLLTQLAAGLNAIHEKGLACRTLVPSKVIINDTRVRIAWCGVADVLEPSTLEISIAQHEDLLSLGRLMLAVACRSTHCDNLSACIELVSCTYSTDFRNILLYLLGTQNTKLTVKNLMVYLTAPLLAQVEALERRSDALEEQLAKEIDNGRLLRIVVKLNVINERPELNMDQSWSETGDRYMLKLFRDHVFHSITEDGRPWIDQAHVTNALNLLDSGSSLKVELMSRDEQSVLVVSYAELKHCLDAAFNEVMNATGVDRDTLQYSGA